MRVAGTQRVGNRAFIVGAILMTLYLLVPVSASNASAGSSNTSPAQTQASSTLPNYVPRSSAPGSFYFVQGGSLSVEVAALEGIAARTRPQLFLGSSSGDQFWLNFSVHQYGLKYTTISQNQALLQFKSLVTDSSGEVKIILYSSKDPISPAQYNIARTLAGVYNALPVSSSELGALQSLYGAGNIKTLYNLEGMFKDKITAYNWAWNLVGSLVTRAFVTTSPSGDAGLTDYAIQHQSFIFEYELAKAMSASETTAATKILSNYPEGTPVLGFFGFGPETQTIDFLSGLGLFMISCDGASDLSFYSGLPEATNLKQVPPAPVTYSSGKTYVAIQYSQGNSLGHLFGMNFGFWTQTDSKGTPIRDEVPESWQINPVTAELAPPIMEYYYQTMSADDYFLSSSSGGAGYVHPDQLPNLNTYLNIANPFNNNANLLEWVIVPGDGRSLQTSVYQQIASATSVQAIFTKLVQSQSPTEVSGVPIFTMTLKIQQTTWSQSFVTSTVKSLTSLSKSNQFIWLFMANANPGQDFVLALKNALPANFVLVRSDQLTSLYEQYLKTT